jgi:hypothetical protein
MRQSFSVCITLSAGHIGLLAMACVIAELQTCCAPRSNAPTSRFWNSSSDRPSSIACVCTQTSMATIRLPALSIAGRGPEYMHGSTTSAPPRSCGSPTSKWHTFMKSGMGFCKFSQNVTSPRQRW